uniref:ARAD1C27104p n=1 Tax=Blastobotrys adeninivorans TaxID=409370 RepID=A0A060T289_BLAAD
MSKVVIVTGASRGIGESIVRRLLKADAVVIGVSRSKEALEALAKENKNFQYVAGDVTDESVTRQAFDMAAKLNRLDGIVFNAGVLEPVERLENATVNEWKKLYDINFFSMIPLIQLSIPMLRESNGKVVFVSSGASKSHYQAWGAYGSSKAAMDHLAGTLATEEPSIQSLSVEPGVVDTQMQTNIRTLHKDPMGDFHNKFIDLHKSGNLVKPEIPASVYANLVLRGWSKDINGKSLRYSVDELKSYLD